MSKVLADFSTKKTTIFSNSNTPKDIQSNIIQIAVVKATGTIEKYISLPAFLSKNKSKAVQGLIDKT